jgi:hypothetical protein
MLEQTGEMVKVDELKNQIQQFTTIEEMKEGKDKLESVRYYLKLKGDERTMIQQLNAGAVRLAWRMGGILKKVISPGRPSEAEEGGKVIRLADFGIVKATSHKYQRISDIPEEVLEERITRMLAADEEISEKEFYKFAKSLDESHNEDENDENDENDGSDRMDEMDEAREQFVAMTREQIAELRKKNISGVELLDDTQLELVAIGIIEILMEGSGKVKRKITKFLFENALDETNYWSGLALAARQLKAVTDSLGRNTNPSSPVALLTFIQNMKQMTQLLVSWKPENLEDCEKCNGTKEIPIEGEGISPGATAPCDNCIDGKVGWYKVTG